MRRSLKTALLLGAVVVGPALAQANDDSPLQGFDRQTERGAARLVRQFDLNKDGRVTHDEMNRTIGARFAAVTRHAPTMTLEQFMATKAAEFRPYNEAMFHRLDWNGDGKLTLAEYAAPQRTRFVMLDREGRGVVSCVGGGYGRGGLGAFCRDNDLNLDGQVTRAELDIALTQRFNAVTGKAQFMTLAQFVTSEEQRFSIVNARTFRRLDTDGDGVLNVREFGGSELALFAKLDKNHDGVLDPGELRLHYTRTARTERGASGTEP